MIHLVVLPDLTETVCGLNVMENDLTITLDKDMTECETCLIKADTESKLTVSQIVDKHLTTNQVRDTSTSNRAETHQSQSLAYLRDWV